MSLQSGQTSKFTGVPSHPHFGLENCPTCGQEIPPDKLEEISGKIAAREREQTLAITSHLEKTYAAEKTEAEAKAKADLESERRESAAREARVREEVQKAAEQSSAELMAGWQQQLAEAELARKSAEQKETTLGLQLNDLRQANEAEVSRIREESAIEFSRIRQVTTEAAEARIRDTLTAHENAVAEASAKARNAEAKVLALTEQQASVMETSLEAQREILEKAAIDAVNAEKARAFEENQKLSTKLDDLQRAFDKKTAEELGEGAEIELFEALKAEFPEDRISPISKGTPGADILHVVMLRGKQCGTILYDSKNHKQFRYDHVTKHRADQLAARADHAVLSTHKFPQGTRQLHIQDGVLLANPARVVFVATIIRQHLMQIHTLRLSDIERESKTAALYEFITSERCSSLLARIDERAEALLERQESEIKWHENNWKKQGEAIREIQKAKADMENQIDSIIGSAPSDAISEAS